MFDPDIHDSSELCDLAEAAMRRLVDRGGRLLEGTLELLDDEVAVNVTNALWDAAQADRAATPDPDGLPLDLDALSDEDLQEAAAAIFTAADDRPGLGFGGLSSDAAARAADRAEDHGDPAVAGGGPTV